MTDEDVIRTRIRRLLDEGTLPRETARGVIVRRNHGGICVACGVAFTSRELEYEVTTQRGLSFRLHRRCIELWAAQV